MTRDELSRLEAELEVRLPEGYVQFMTGEDFAAWAASTLLQEHPEVLFSEVHHLKTFNHELRADQAPYVLNGLPWPDAFFAFGEDGNGDIYAFDLSQGNETVWRYSHDHGLFGQESVSVLEFVQQQHQNHQEARKREEHQIQAAEERLQRRLKAARNKKNSGL